MVCLIVVFSLMTDCFEHLAHYNQSVCDVPIETCHAITITSITLPSHTSLHVSTYNWPVPSFFSHQSNITHPSSHRQARSSNFKKSNGREPTPEPSVYGIYGLCSGSETLGGDRVLLCVPLLLSQGFNSKFVFILISISYLL